MVYRVLGLMSGSSLDGIDLALAEFQLTGGRWQFTLKQTACYPYDAAWTARLAGASQLTARDYLLLHSAYGAYLAGAINRFIEENGLVFQIQLIASHGHTVFHLPEGKMTAQLGDGAAIAAGTGINTVSDLRAMDVALGGQGAPIVPIGDRLLWPDTAFLLNIGGIANLTRNTDSPVAFDICPANRVLNLLAADLGKAYDADGAFAASGTVNNALLEQLNALDYYRKSPPKSLDNEFGTETVYALIRSFGLGTIDALATYTRHIAEQIAAALAQKGATAEHSLLITGGGAHNKFLVQQIQQLTPVNITVPDAAVIDYKEALVMAFIGVLRWREEANVLASVTGAKRDSIGGAVWIA